MASNLHQKPNAGLKPFILQANKYFIEFAIIFHLIRIVSTDFVGRCKHQTTLNRRVCTKSPQSVTPKATNCEHGRCVQV